MKIVKLKFVDENGNPKGRTYTYYTPVEVDVDDIVEIGPGQRGVITAVDVPEKEIEKFADKMKTIIGLWRWEGTGHLETTNDSHEEPPIAKEPDAGILAMTIKSRVDISDTLIVIDTLPVLRHKLREVKGQIDAQVDEALAMPVTDETKVAIKQVRADLNKQLKAAEDLRIAIKNKLLEPYNEVENEFRECITNRLKDADATLSSRINEIESAQKDEKRREVIEYFEELKESSGLEFVKIEDIGLTFTLSASTIAMKKQVKAWFNNVQSDLSAIVALADDIKSEVLLEYKKTYDLSASIRVVTARKKALEAQREQEASYKARTASRIEKEAEVNQILQQEKITVPQAKQEPQTDSLMIYTFELTMNEIQKELFRQFLSGNHIKAVCLKKEPVDNSKAS